MQSTEVGIEALRDHLEDLGVDGGIILGWILNSKLRGCRHNRIKWSAVVCTVTNLGVQQDAADFLTT